MSPPSSTYGNQRLAEGIAGNAFLDMDALDYGRPAYYYQVLEDGQSDPPGFELNPPIPVPFLSSVTPDAGVAGDVVSLTGGNFNPTGASMTVTFDGLYADILSSSENSLTVEVPEGALTGDVQVCRSGICSNSLLFKITVGPAFEDISSIGFEAGTGSLWIADRGAVDDVFELEPDGTLTARGSLGQPVLAYPSPADGNGRVYYCNSVDSEFNFGSIEYIDSATNAKGFFDNAGGSGDPVHCEALAANDLEPEVVYYLDGEGDTVRRVEGLVPDFMYGDQPFTFNSPAGARFDSGGNLYLSATTAVYRILPMEAGVELVASGFSAAAGIDLTETSGLPILLVADEASGEVWLVNGETGDKEVVGSGFDGPVAVAFTEDLVTGELYYDVAEPTRILRLPDPQVEFLNTQDTRVLLSKTGSGDSYPAAGLQTVDGQIEVQVKVIDNVDPAGTTVYFRLIDPKDPSPYLNGQNDDNLPSSPGGTITPSAVVGPDGIASAVLTVDPNNSGNNYRVEVSFDAPPNFKKRGRSKVYTSWRRLYIEHDRMYKEGAFITQTSGAGEPNPERVFVGNPGTFTVGDEVHILSGSSPMHSEGEISEVVSVGASFVDLASPLTITYEAPIPDPHFPFPYSFLARRAGGFFDSNPVAQVAASAFEDAFTEWLLTPDEGYVPSWEHLELPPSPPSPEVLIAARTTLFFKNFDQQSQEARRNFVQVVSASRAEEVPPPPPGPPHALFGKALAEDNWTWIFVGTIEQLAPGNVGPVTVHVVAHELGHQLDVNPGSAPGFGHDTEQSWHDPALGCLMNEQTPINTPGGARFHGAPAPSQDLLCVRTHTDDLGDDQCPIFP